jgi:serine/threonine-protein kinase
VPAEQTLLGGRYEIGDVIGHGGMAEVHVGRDVRIGRDVAVKLLRSDLARDPGAQGRFQREAHSAASLNSPSIVAVYDTGEGLVDGVTTPYIVMEYVEGQTLRDLLAAEGPLPPTRALEITAAVCTALEQAHAAGIVHRDIKPANVMLTRSGEVKVMDFGIARTLAQASSTLTQTQAVVGTAHYLSPEQARGDHVDARSDIYSTGCLLYELLTGAPPFTGDTAVSVAYQHVREDPVPPSVVKPGVPAALDAIVLVAMAKNPIDRYATAELMRADIERAMLGKPVLATPVRRDDGPLPPGTATSAAAPRGGRRWATYLLLALAVIAVVVVVLLVVRGLVGGDTGDLNTPDVVGQSLADAEATLSGQGLTVGTVGYQFTTKDDKGTVLAESPPAGVLLHRGQSVNLTVSNGIRYVPVPTGLVGLSQAQAKAALTAAGLKAGHVVSKNSDASAGQVLNTTPNEGTSVAAGSKVTLVVSNAQVKVPDVTGMPVATAAALLQQDGFLVSQRDSAVYKQGKDGTIISQSPTGRTYAANGSVVDIYVDTPPPKPSPKPTHRSPSPTTSSSASSSPSPTPTGTATQVSPTP